MDRRSTAVLKLLAKSEEYTTVEELAVQLNVSRRTIYSDIAKVNDWLQVHHNCQIEKVHGMGLYIPDNKRSAIIDSHGIEGISYYEYSKNERMAWITLLLSVDLQNPYFIDTFQSLFRISRNTVIDDIKVLKNELSDKELILESKISEGYRIEGEEVKIRQTVMTTVQFLDIDITCTTEQNRLIPYPLLDSQDAVNVRDIIYSYETELSISITEDIRPVISTWLFCFMQRIRNRNLVRLERPEKEAILSAPEFLSASKILYRYLDDLPECESVYFTRILLGAKINFSKSADYEREALQNLESATANLIDDFEHRAMVFFPEKDALYRNLLLHMKTAYYRIKYRIRINNPLKERIREDYSDIFSLTKQVIEPAERLIGQSVNDDELAYITIHFGGWLKRNALSINKRILKVMLVCTNGIGTSRIMEHQMMDILPEYEVVSLFSEKDYEQSEDLEKAVDFVVSSIPLNNRGAPVIVVNPLFSKKDREKLLFHGKLDEYLNTKRESQKIDTLIDIIRKYADINDDNGLRKELTEYTAPDIKTESDSLKPGLETLLPKHRIEVSETSVEWNAALDMASEVLIRDRIITHRYVEAMKHIIIEKGAYMVLGDGIAFPHAPPSEGVLQTGMSMLLLKNSVRMEDKKVKLFIILASEDNERHLKAMTELTAIFSNKYKRQEIMNAQNKAELIDSFDYNSTGRS